MAQRWAEKRLYEDVERIGFNQEWVKGRCTEISAIIAIATEKDVLICQQLYMPFIPDALRRIIHNKNIKTCGPASSLGVHKKGLREFCLRGYEHTSLVLLNLIGKRKRKNLPKVLRDLDFRQLAKLIVAVEREIEGDMSDAVRWDKPVFSEKEVTSTVRFPSDFTGLWHQIEYQALEAWTGWALTHVFYQCTADHLERFRAYLQVDQPDWRILPKRDAVCPGSFVCPEKEEDHAECASSIWNGRDEEISRRGRRRRGIGTVGVELWRDNAQRSQRTVRRALPARGSSAIVYMTWGTHSCKNPSS